MRIFLYLPEGRDAQVVGDALAEREIDYETFDDLQEAVDAVGPTTAALLLQQESMGAGSARILEQLLDVQPRWSDLPVMILIGRGNRPPNDLQCLARKYDITFVERPVRKSLLRTMALSAIESRRRQINLRDTLEDLRAAKEAAETANRAKSAFLSQMSHDLRTPLTSVIGYSEILSHRLTSNTDQNMAQAIAESGQRLLHILNSLLELARLEGEKAQLQSEPVEMERELAAVEREFRHHAEEKDLSLQVDCERHLRVNANSTGLGRVLMNLVGNAIKYTETGTVSVRARQCGQDVVIEVDDTGPGIPEEFIPQLFEPFKRASRAGEGSGLGLAITKELVELMGGSIDAELRKPCGMRFVVCLPVAPDERVQQRDEPPIRDDRWKRVRLLLVEDNEHTREVVRQFLPDAIHLTSVGDYDAALREARFRAHEVVLLDVNLGEERTGVDLLRNLRQISGYENVPVIAFTAFALQDDRERYQELGFDDLLPKPISRRALRERLAAALSSNHLARMQRPEGNYLSN